MIEEPTYLIFRMKRERVESLLKSYLYHEQKLKDIGYVMTGTLPRFFSEVNALLYKKGRKIAEGSKK